MKELQIDARARIVHFPPFNLVAMKQHRHVCQTKQQNDCLAEDLSYEESDIEDYLWVTDDEKHDYFPYFENY